MTLKSHNLKIKISIYKKQQVVEPSYPWPMTDYLEQKYSGALYSPDCRTLTALVCHCSNLSHIRGELETSNFKPAASFYLSLHNSLLELFTGFLGLINLSHRNYHYYYFVLRNALSCNYAANHIFFKRTKIMLYLCWIHTGLKLCSCSALQRNTWSWEFQRMACVALKNKEIQHRKRRKRQKKKGISEAISISFHANPTKRFFHDSVNLFVTLAACRAKCWKLSCQKGGIWTMDSTSRASMQC